MNLQIIKFTFLIIIFLIITYYIIYHIKPIVSLKNKSTLVPEMETLNRDFEKKETVYNLVNRETLTLPNKANTLIITWQMYIPNIGSELLWTSNYSGDKPIIRIGNTPHIYYNPKHNKISVITKYIHTPFKYHFPTIELHNIKQQKWNTYTILIQSMKVLIYVNGELVKSHILDNPIKIDDSASSEIIVGELNNNIAGAKINNLELLYDELTHNQLKMLNM